MNESCGISIKEVRVIPDIQKTIVNTVLELKRKYNYVFTTGGIGPTHDDITAKSISKALNVKYEYHKEAYNILEEYYGKQKFNDGRKKMAKMPKGSSLIYNPSSAAPGFKIKNIFCLPGVPSILKSMIENTKKYLKKGSKSYSKTINANTVESHIAKELTKVQNKYKNEISIGSYPFFRLGKVGVSIVIRSKNEKKINNCFILIKKILKMKKVKTLNLKIK